MEKKMREFLMAMWTSCCEESLTSDYLENFDAAEKMRWQGKPAEEKDS